jgi:exopolyphosphatase/guanosine-5'-triphosphate,3'-diphosphate pyrophosphatase
MRKAVIDVGSNSVLLLVAERRDGQWMPIFEDTAVTALGEGTKRTGVLREDRIDQTLRALRTMFAAAQELGCVEVRAAATMAVRIAQNASEFLARCREQGTPVEVISGDEEARLGFESVAQDPRFSAYDRLSIVDPGGHSTELMTAQRGADGQFEMLFRKSFPVGTLGLKSQVHTSESPGPDEILPASTLIDDLVAAAWPKIPAGAVVVLGATGTNLISIREGLVNWEPEKVHGAYLMFEEISRAVGFLMMMSDQDRAAIRGMEPGRERTIHVGALILERFLHVIGAEGCTVSVRGWRYSMLA